MLWNENEYKTFMAYKYLQCKCYHTNIRMIFMINVCSYAAKGLSSQGSFLHTKLVNCIFTPDWNLYTP